MLNLKRPTVKCRIQETYPIARNQIKQYPLIYKKKDEGVGREEEKQGMRERWGKNIILNLGIMMNFKGKTLFLARREEKSPEGSGGRPTSPVLQSFPDINGTVL